MTKRAQAFLQDFQTSVFLFLYPSLMQDWSRGVDGERYIEIVRPIPTTSKGKNFELRRETIGAYDKGKAGLVLEEQTVLVDATSGEIYTKFIGSSFFVGQVPPLVVSLMTRADMGALRVRRSRFIRPLGIDSLIRSQNFRQRP